jgi:hypothetical protein
MEKDFICLGLFSFEDLENAATTSRLTHDKMTIDETKLFPDVSNGEADLYKMFLYIRNKIVGDLRAALQLSYQSVSIAPVF